MEMRGRILVFAAVAISLAAGAATANPGGAMAAPERPDTPLTQLVPKKWLGKCTDQLPKNFSKYLRKKSNLYLKGNNQKVAWNWYPYGMSMLNMYELTGDEIYLRGFTEAYDQLIGRVDSKSGRRDRYRGRVTDAWGFKYPGGRGWTTTTAVTGRIAEAGLRFARIAPAEFQDVGKQYRRVAKAALAEFKGEYRVWKRRGYYHDPIQRIPEPINHAHALGDALVEAYRHDGSYAKEIRGMSRWFKWSKWKQKGGAWAWAYRSFPGDRQASISDRTIKATVAIRFPVGAAGQKIGFKKSSLKPLVKTVLGHVMRPRGINRHIARKDFVGMGSSPARTSVVRFADLDRVDRRVGKRIIKLVGKRCGDYPRGWTTNKHTTIALTELLLNRRS